MFSVAFVGADGAGKTTISQRLLAEQPLPVPIKYVYMGINPEASNVMLPTTWFATKIKRIQGKPLNKGGPPDPSRARDVPLNPAKRLLFNAKSLARVVNMIMDECFRQCLVWYYGLRGWVVLFDRHFFIDYYAHDVAKTTTEKTLARRLHGFWLRHFMPRPHLVVFLDAPAEVLFARKGEGSISLLEARRREYGQLQSEVDEFVMVDATQPEDSVLAVATELLQRAYQARR